MSKYNVKVDGQIYQVEVNDAETNTTNNEESSASICFEAIKAEYDYCVTRAEKLENKVYILQAACAFIFVLLTTQIEKAGNVNLPQTKPELCGIIFYAILLVIAIVSNVVMQTLYEAQNIFNSLRMKRNVKIRNKYDQATQYEYRDEVTKIPRTKGSKNRAETVAQIEELKKLLASGMSADEILEKPWLNMEIRLYDGYE